MMFGEEEEGESSSSPSPSEQAQHPTSMRQPPANPLNQQQGGGQQQQQYLPLASIQSQEPPQAMPSSLWRQQQGMTSSAALYQQQMGGDMFERSLYGQLQSQHLFAEQQRLEAARNDMLAAMGQADFVGSGGLYSQQQRRGSGLAALQGGFIPASMTSQQYPELQQQWMNEQQQQQWNRQGVSDFGGMMFGGADLRQQQQLLGLYSQQQQQQASLAQHHPASDFGPPMRHRSSEDWTSEEGIPLASAEREAMRRFGFGQGPYDFQVPPEQLRKDKKPRVKTFPQKLIEAMIQFGDDESIAWLPDGKSFVIVNPNAFVSKVLNPVFKAAKYASFVRKLHRWGFVRLTSGTGTDCFHHPLFNLNRPEWASKITCKAPKKDPNKKDDVERPPSLAGVERFIRAKAEEMAQKKRAAAKKTTGLSDTQDFDPINERVVGGNIRKGTSRSLHGSAVTGELSKDTSKAAAGTAEMKEDPTKAKSASSSPFDLDLGESHAL